MWREEENEPRGFRSKSATSRFINRSRVGLPWEPNSKCSIKEKHNVFNIRGIFRSWGLVTYTKSVPLKKPENASKMKSIIFLSRKFLFTRLRTILEHCGFDFQHHLHDMRTSKTTSESRSAPELGNYPRSLIPASLAGSKPMLLGARDALTLINTLGAALGYWLRGLCDTVNKYGGLHWDIYTCPMSA